MKQSAVLLLVAVVALIAFRGPLKRWGRSMAADLGYGAGLMKREYTWTGHIASDAPFAAKNWLGSWLGSAEVPLLALEIKFKHLSRLRQQRAEAIACGVLVQQEGDLMPATIRLPDRAVRIKLRLKGDIVAGQFDDESWSFRVQVRGDDHLFGMRRCNLQAALGRDYHSEPLFLEHVRHLGVLAPRYMFVRVALNGEDLGLMALEEHFSKELLESQDRREGVILKIDESRFFSFLEREDRFASPFNSFLTGDLLPFRRSRVERNPVLADDLRVATGLYRAFVEGTLEPSQVFDAKLFGRFMAVAQVWGAWHAASWRNIRFYYNPITALLEPIAYDAELISVGYHTPEALHGRLFADARIRDHYVATLKAIADRSPEALPIRLLAKRQEQHLAVLHRFLPFLKPFDLSAMAAVAADSIDEDPVTRIRYDPLVDRPRPDRAIEPSRFRPRDMVLVHLLNEGSDRCLEVCNLMQFPLIVRTSLHSDVPPILIPPTPYGDLPSRVRIDLEDSEKTGKREDVEQVHVAGIDNEQGAWVRARPYFCTARARPVPRPSLESVSAHAFLEYDAVTRMVTSKPGRWDVSGVISLPDGVGLTLTPGTELRFEPDGALVTRGPTRFLGEAENRVVLRGRGNTGSSPWRGVAVFNSGTRAEWSFVRVIGTTGVQFEDWRLTGGVTLYGGEVAISKSEFVGNTAEDALNLVHTSFALEEVDVADAVSDAIDFDFSVGTIAGGTLSNIGSAGGGDGLDFSGARATVMGTRFSRIRDKAISVGERSKVRVRRITVAGAGVGAASKDGSHLVVESADLARIGYAALMAYVKKPEFGGAVLDAGNLTLGPVARVSQVQNGSLLRIDGVATETIPLDVDVLYTTVMWRGKRH